MGTIKVLIVEDSKLMQEIIAKTLSADPEIEVVGIADDPLIARDLIKKLNPNVLTLDIMLPHMDGITFLKNIMRLHPMPVIMISNLTQKGSAIALEALSIGAVDYLPKPTKTKNDLEKFTSNLIKVVKIAAKANIVKNIVPLTPIDNQFRTLMSQSTLLKDEIIGIGASTGGIEAIETILLQLPQVFPPIVIVQHIKKEFSSSFAKRISKVYGLSAVEPMENTELKPGHIYIAPAETHLKIIRNSDFYVAVCDHSPPVKNHKPSIDVLFQSLAEIAGSHAIGVLLTGMGTDGAVGLKQIRDAGGITIAQDEKTSMVWGMPGAAVKLQAATYVVPLNQIHQKILQVIDHKVFGEKELID